MTLSPEREAEIRAGAAQGDAYRYTTDADRDAMCLLLAELDRLRMFGEQEHAERGVELERLRGIITRAQNAADSGDLDAVRAALADACPRCKGSGIDPEYSSPGCTDPDRGAEPPNLEPCVACQYPLEAELVDDAAVVPAGGEGQ
jgi:hypothetical protein